MKAEASTSAPSLRHRIELGAYVLGAALMRALPSATGRRLAAAGGRAYFRIGGKRRRRMLANLRIAYPEANPADLAEIGRQSYVHFAWNLIDLMREERWTDSEVRARVSLVGIEDFRRLLDKGTGALRPRRILRPGLRRSLPEFDRGIPPRAGRDPADRGRHAALSLRSQGSRAGYRR